MAFFDRWLAGGMLGGLGISMAFPGLPELAATQILTLINTVIGLGGFGTQIALSSLIPSGASLGLGAVGAAVIPALAGIGTTILIIVGMARRQGGEA